MGHIEKCVIEAINEAVQNGRGSFDKSGNYVAMPSFPFFAQIDPRGTLVEVFAPAPQDYGNCFPRLVSLGVCLAIKRTVVYDNDGMSIPDVPKTIVTKAIGLNENRHAKMKGKPLPYPELETRPLAEWKDGWLGTPERHAVWDEVFGEGWRTNKDPSQADATF